MPVPWSDNVLYASVARALARTGGAVPGIIRNTPGAVDHLAFYGPVFFELAAWSLRLFGLSIASVRLVCVLGAVIAAVGGAQMAGAMGGSRARQWLAASALLLTPELGDAATNGRMDALAVGLAILCLALLARALARRSPSPGVAAAAGLVLALAGLTTPRELPFVAAVALSGATLAWASPDRRLAMIAAFALALATCAATLLAWSVAEHGSPLRWLRYLAFIATREDSDVALLPSAARFWWAVPWSVLSTVAAVLGALGLATSIGARPHERRADTDVWTLLLVAAWINLVMTMALFKITFGFAVYFALPLLAVVLAAPPHVTAARPLTAAAITVALIAGSAGMRTVKYVRSAATWSARDPRRIERFVRDHVPPGSFVMGPEDFYFFAVARAGSSYLSIEPTQGAEWTRWVPLFDRQASERVPSPSRRAARFAIWPRDEARFPLVERYACAHGHAIAVYRAPADDLRLLGPLAWKPGIPGYPDTVLYRLPPDCPLQVAR